MKIYIIQKGFKILNVVDEIDENDIDSYEEFNIDNLDDFIHHMEMKKYKYDEYIIDIAEDIFNDVKNDREKTLSSFKIRHWVSNRSFGELIDMFVHDEIIKPDMQRNFVWSSLKSSRLIESIIMGLPIPPLFLFEISSNKYELIDGFQRLFTIVNFVKGYPWKGNISTKRNYTSRLSKKISIEIAGKTFSELDENHKRTILRSTIPLIEFSQQSPDNTYSKYEIFERINTGSEKLNPMQIRKSLAHGKFIKDLYDASYKDNNFLSFFSADSIKKDNHVEAYLRIIAISELYNSPNKDRHKKSIKEYLDEYCEVNRDKSIDLNKVNKISEAVNFVLDIFETPSECFRRVEKDNKGNFIYSGNLNISIMESFIGVYIYSDTSMLEKNKSTIKAKYDYSMSKVLIDSLNKTASNPFSSSTSTIESINKRYEIISEILLS